MTIDRGTPLDALPELLRVPEVARWADCGVSTIYEAVAAGQLPAVRLGRLLRVPRAGIGEWLKGRTR